MRLRTDNLLIRHWQPHSSKNLFFAIRPWNLRLPRALELGKTAPVLSDSRLSADVSITGLSRRLRNRLRLPLSVFLKLNRSKRRFDCPICKYQGPFIDLHGFAGVRKHAQCPRCKSLERHRLQHLIVAKLFPEEQSQRLRMLHVAPEPFLSEILSKTFGHYETADLTMKEVDHRVDLQALPFADANYDVVFASHVLEHIRDDSRALREIRRILKPGGLAILPVPVVCEQTVEYPQPNPHEADHVRAPGWNYFERYELHFSRVDVYTSDSVPDKYQTFIYEDRSGWPTKNMPLRRPMEGTKHRDAVPVCYV